MRNKLEDFWQNESGVTSVEYALLAAAAAAVIGVAGSNFYTSVQTAFQGISLTDGANAGPDPSGSG
ncbi:Flp family type IVb pilin [Sneathiella marina]|uniref:Flp family type IVb pilin n=1 Tax=Sneathiella marina TaxID=2950108 RepID=A0ABY4W7L1_9PROT|nr:Flp family type IVb pilin [Sneathiella marina]USG63033.1 Flp family type IVb pilin [Sneathiella marina]